METIYIVEKHDNYGNRRNYEPQEVVFLNKIDVYNAILSDVQENYNNHLEVAEEQLKEGLDVRLPIHYGDYRYITREISFGKF